MIHDLFHVSYTVSDLDRSVAWYTDLLRFELVHRQVQDNEYTRKLVGISDASLEVAQLRIPAALPSLSTHLLELVQYITPEGRSVELATPNVGIAHIAILITDIDKEYERLAAHGVRFRNPPIEIAEGVNKGGAACYLWDPDGFTLELVQPPLHRLQALGLLESSAGARD